MGSQGLAGRSDLYSLRSIAAPAPDGKPVIDDASSNLGDRLAFRPCDRAQLLHDLRLHPERWELGHRHLACHFGTAHGCALSP